MKRVPVSVIIPAKNEKTNIVPVLNALRDWADEIFVVDSQSTDGMPEVVAQIAASTLNPQPLTSNVFNFTLTEAIRRRKIGRSTICQFGMSGC